MLKLKRNEQMLIIDCLVSKKAEICRLVDDSHFSDFRPLYVNWVNDIDVLINKFRKEFSYEEKNN